MTDSLGKKCERCGEGTYKIADLNDEIHGERHCNKCGHLANRHENESTTDAQIRRTIQKTIEQEMPLRLLKRIVYEVRCEEMGIIPDGWKLYPEDCGD